MVEWFGNFKQSCQTTDTFTLHLLHVVVRCFNTLSYIYIYIYISLNTGIICFQLKKNCKDKVMTSAVGKVAFPEVRDGNGISTRREHLSRGSASVSRTV